ncbi:MAG: insulinase family protein [Candidatus Eremiobacteraeota bacterium]|nr:insulinase family protein [Candidatus Eremiobacteraeota bacterium]
MIARATLAAATLGVASLFLVPVPSHAAMMQQLGALPRGGSYVLDPDPTVDTAAIGLWFRAPGAGYDNTTPGISDLAATAAAVTPLASGRSLYELVHTLGGNLNIEVYPDIVGIAAAVPASAARRVVAAMTAAYFVPTIDEKALKTARANAAVLGVQERYEADSTLHDLLFKQIFAAGPAHYPTLPTSVAQITSLSAEQVSAFAKRAFRAENSVLTLSGNVDQTSVTAVTDGNGSGAMDPPYDSPLTSAPVSATATGSVDGVGLAWIGPPISDEKAATALDFVADYLFRDQTGVVMKALDRAKSDALVVGQFITLHDPGVMVVTIGGDEEKQAERRVLDALTALQQPLDARTFEAAREAFLYHVASDTQTPQERADNLGWYSTEGNLSYAPGIANGNYERNVRALDPQFVAGVVRRYLNKPIVVDLIASTPQKEGQ